MSTSEEKRLPPWPIFGALAIAAVGVLIAVLWPQASTSLRVDNPGSKSGSSVLPNVAEGTPYTFATFPVCVADGDVTIDRVDLHDDTAGLTVVDFALAKASAAKIDGAKGRAAAQPGFTGGKMLTAKCADPRLLAVSVERTSDVGYAHGFEVHSGNGTVLIPQSVELCAATCPKGFPLRYP